MTDEGTNGHTRFAAWDPARARDIAEALSGKQGACLPILHALQETFGYIHDEAIPVVADVLNLSRAEVVGVVHFYHDFRHEPPGRHQLRVCRAESCQAMGGELVVDALTSALGVEPGATTADGAVTFDSVYCLGNCALSPALMWDGRLVGHVTPERATAMVTAVTR